MPKLKKSCRAKEEEEEEEVCTAQHVSSVLTPIIRSSTTAVAASGFTFGAWW
jgi:hypothetical protein